MKILFGIVLIFLLAFLMFCRSWRSLTAKQRMLAALLLLPHFLLISCFILSLACGKAAPGTACYNDQFLSGVLMVFFLPLPAVIGTAAAFGLFFKAR